MSTHFPRHIRLVAMGAIAAAALAACGGGSDDDDGPDQGQPAANGTLTAAIQTSAPSCGLDAVNVTITKLRFHKDATAAADASGWVDVPVSPAKKINLLNAATVLSGATTALGDSSLAAGGYSQVRVVLDTAAGANSIRVSGASADVAVETPATLGSAGIRVPLDVAVTSGQAASTVLDFDACYAVQQRGATYVLKPWGRAVPATLNGISGFVNPSVLASGVTITAQQGAAIFATTTPHPTTGEFRLPRLAAGNYDVVIQGRQRATAVIGVVPVTAGSTTAISTATAPITLAASDVSSIAGTITYTAPAVAPDSGTWVQASQIVSANTTVGNAATTVAYRFQPVDLASGAFTLTNLPRASIQYALYKAGQAPVLANAATTLGTGRYRVESIATGFSPKTTTASANVNVGTANATGIAIPLP